MFFMWDGNHRLQVWMPYICFVYDDDVSWHISMDSILLDVFHGLVELLTIMTDLNKSFFNPYLALLLMFLSSIAM